MSPPARDQAGSRVAWRNWARNQRGVAARLVRPRGTAEIAAAVRAAADQGLAVRVVGSGHSFTPAALTDGVLVALDRHAGLVRVDGELVTVQAGMRLHGLNDVLAEHGLALPNLGDIDRQTVAGAIATGSHGTGERVGGLASFVAALTLVDGRGEVVRAEAGSDLLAAAAVSMGALGVVSEVTLRCVPAFVLHADERPMPLEAVLEGFDELMAGNDHAEFHWFPGTRVALTKRNNRVPVDDEPLPTWRGWLDDELLANTAYGAMCRTGRTVPRLVPAMNRLASRALTARRYTARSDRVFCSPRRVRFVEMEYALPRAAIHEAFGVLRKILAQLPFPVAIPVEVRVAAADDCWLSTAYRRDTVYLAVHQYVGMPYRPFFAAVEELCTALDGRPHWGKLHGRDAVSLRAAYPRLARFGALRDRLDPERRFANGYTHRVLGR